MFSDLHERKKTSIKWKVQMFENSNISYLLVDAEDYPVASLVVCYNPVRHPSPGASVLFGEQRTKFKVNPKSNPYLLSYHWCGEDRVETAEVNSFAAAQARHHDSGQLTVACDPRVCRTVRRACNSVKLQLSFNIFLN
jgi:hypothetical protein